MTQSNDSTQKRERAACCKAEHLEYLFDLRESAVTNMFGARPYLMNAFPELTKDEALSILAYWMHTPREEQLP